MHIDDLVRYVGRIDDDGKNLVAVGWLGRGSFRQGEVPPRFVSELLSLCDEPIHKTRGFHVCPFCVGSDAARGNGEVHVLGNDCVYVAPSLIGHYVVEHGYQPPSSFIEAVSAMTKSNSSDVNSELGKSVLRLADAPNEDNKRRFYSALLDGRVGIRVPKELGSVPSGEYVTAPDSDLRIPKAQSSSGEDMLLVLANVAWLHENEPGSGFVEMDGRDVLRIACNDAAGVIVQVLGPERQGWSGVPARDIPDMLDSAAT